MRQGPGLRRRRRGELSALAVLALAAFLGTAVADSSPVAEPGEPRIRLTLRGGKVRDLQSLRRLPDGTVRLHFVEGGTVEVDPVWILDWEYSEAYLAELARGGASLPRHCDPLVSSRISRWDELIATEAAEHDLAPELVRAVIAVESCGDPLAVSSAGAVGLMQLMPGTAADLGCADSRDPASNVDAGCRHLRRLLTLFDDDLELGLAAYHAGEGVVHRLRRVPPYPSTERYVRLVTTELGRLSREK